MGRDRTGIIVYAKDEAAAYRKARKILERLVKDEALGFFLTYDDLDNEEPVKDFPAFKGLSRAMLVDKAAQNKGYQLVQEIIRIDQATNYQIEKVEDLIAALSSLKTREQIKRFLLHDKITYVKEGKRTTETFVKSTMAYVGDTDKFVHGIYAQYWGKVNSYTALNWVLARDPNDFSDRKKVQKIMQDPEYKIWVVPALSKT